jgi:hypothetical protein
MPKTGKNITKDHKLNQVAIKDIIWQQKRPNGLQIYQHIPLQGTPKFTPPQKKKKFGFKIHHLATML